jgi:hypothetical protein
MTDKSIVFIQNVLQLLSNMWKNEWGQTPNTQHAFAFEITCLCTYTPTPNMLLLSWPHAVHAHYGLRISHLDVYVWIGSFWKWSSRYISQCSNSSQFTSCKQQQGMIYTMCCVDMICFDMIWYDMTWYDMTWHDMIWYDIICIRKTLLLHLTPLYRWNEKLMIASHIHLRNNSTC